MGKGIVKLGEGNWAVKDGNLLAAKETNGRFKNAEFTVARGTDATYVGRDGLIANETGDDTPRIDFTDNTDGHLLLEPQSTNLITYSEDFSQWTTSNFTPNSETTTAPNGDTVNGYDFGDGFIYIDTADLDGTSDYVNTIYIKANKSATIGMRKGGAGSAANNTSINLTTDWQRFEAHSVTSITTNGRLLLDNRAASGYGVANLEVFIWGAQQEKLSYATSYIPTNGSTVTRDADTCNNSGEAIDFNSEEGVLYVEIAALANDGLNKRITISDGTLTNRITLTLGNSNISGFINVNNSTQYTFFESITTTDFNKIAIKFKANDFAVWINGVEYDIDTSGSTFSANTLNVINFANATITDNDFYGKCKAIRVYKEALSDTDLENLTS